MSLVPAPQQPEQNETISIHFAAQAEVRDTEWYLALGLYSVSGDVVRKWGLFYGNYEPHLMKAAANSPKQLEP